MTLTYLVDGELVPADDAVVNVRDRGFLYGDAAFETMRVYGGSIHAWDRHMDRLDDTCDLLALAHDIPRGRLKQGVDRVLDANDESEAAIRLSITRGVQPGVLSPAPEIEPTVVIIIRPLNRGGTEGAPTWDGPAAVRIVDVTKIPDDAIPASAKTHNYLNGILARLELHEDEDEAIMCDREGTITEGATSNLFVVEDGRLMTPPVSTGVLPGITRATVLELADHLEIPVEETRISPEMLRTADEAFLTNSTAEVWPIGSVDGVQLSRGSITDSLQTTFCEAIEAEHYG